MSEGKKNNNLSCENNHDLIVTIVDRGSSELILKASKEAGAEGGTVIYGRGTGIHEKSTIIGIPIEPEKEIILTVIPKSKTKEILKAIIDAGNLNKPGIGIVFVLEIKEVAGICHLLENL